MPRSSSSRVKKIVSSLLARPTQMKCYAGGTNLFPGRNGCESQLFRPVGCECLWRILCPGQSFNSANGTNVESLCERGFQGLAADGRER